jgi:protein required for attachment to host cells
MSKIWVVVAESSRARILAVENRVSPLREVEDLMHPEARVKEQNLISDRPGRMLNSSTEGQHLFEEPTDPRQHEARIFAKRVADRLDQARVKGECGQIVLIAAPEFLGMLRQELNSQTMKLVGKTLDKNLIHKTEQEIRSYLFS